MTDLLTIPSHFIPLLGSLDFDRFELTSVPQFDDPIDSRFRQAKSNDREDEREQKVENGFVGNVESFKRSLESGGWKGVSLHFSLSVKTTELIEGMGMYRR